jgi:putative phosphoesterase
VTEIAMRVGIVSDTHDREASVKAVVAKLRECGITHVFHCGDIETVATVRLFAGFQTHFVLGNWDGDWIPGVNCGLAPRAPDGRKRDAARLRRAIDDAGARLHEPWGELELEGRHLAWVHGNDRALLKELEKSECYDYLFYGHTHRAEQHRVGRTLVINPGALFKVYPMTFAILDLLRGDVETVAVD